MGTQAAVVMVSKVWVVEVMVNRVWAEVMVSRVWVVEGMVSRVAMVAVTP